jgi:chromosome condensin MukBEF ATPase and DNA-binding subunit MukB
MPESRRSSDRPSDAIDVSRIEHENLVAEVVTNRQRFERLEKQVAQFAAELDALKKLLHVRATP